MTNFAGQWLYLRNLAASNPDARFSPISTTTCGSLPAGNGALLREHRQGRPHRARPLQAKYSRQRSLARHYGIPNVYGSASGASRSRTTASRRAPWSRQHPDGHVVRERTSPLLRGKWILENILGTPPPATAAERPSAEGLPRRRAGSSPCGNAWPSTVRIPRARAAITDGSAGLSMENFDAIGRWRTRNEAGTAR